ncbi:helicase-exonuclease AddAB subunit AddB [Metabacillus endolithicus]|uniref:ATP-dependent helicase/deoxyribonuclease subunit B n=1 Tax=Metabacillus endolithicus TaxID=1535204 RepID=A0ABW5C1H9_9BACI|nr:helicase-exonuclease AddAB subunit AddB [Metabacillus endolithicus]UPG62330.1 helicase-exonuclease AddAB subunit AddB [Metabacillus endolithicus]
MSIQFILGRSGTGKTETILNEIRDRLFQEPIGRPIIYLVPDQMTFGAEYELIRTPNLGGMIRAQTFSFSRLAWRVLQETGGMTRHHLSGTGIQMLLRKLVEEYKQDFKVFAKASDKNGFIEQLEVMLTEFKRYCLSPQELEEFVANAQTEHDRKSLTDKLHDMAILYKQLEIQLSHKYVDSEDYLKLLAEKVENSSYLQSADIYIDGFHSFTPQEYEVVAALMKHAQNVKIALTADKAYKEFLPHELHLFQMTGKTYNTILKLATEAGKQVDEPILLKEQHRYAGSQSLQHLEAFYDIRPTTVFDQDPGVTIYQAANRRSEVEGIAREIQSLIRNGQYRYRDLALLIRNSNDYRDVIEQVFRDYEVPFFIDQKRSMLNHPLVELIRSTIEIINGFWRYEAVFRAVKTELLFPTEKDKYVMREDMDLLENYVLSYGIQGSKWTNGDRFRYRRFYSLDDEFVVTDDEKEMEDKLNQLRELIVQPIQTLHKRLKKSQNGQEMAEALFLYLEELHIPKKLEALRIAAEEKGLLLEAREHDQVWQAVINLLDEFVEMMAEEPVSLKLFSEMLETGLESMKFSLVPPAIDQVLIADLEKSRFFNVKCSFIVGVNDGVIPARPKEEGILTEDDREALHYQGVNLAPTARQQLLDENFIIYMALSSSSEKLYLSYAMADEEGKALLPSVIIKRMEEMFPTIKQQRLLNEPEQLSPKEQLSFIVNQHVTLSYVTSQLQSWKRGYPIHSLWWDAYNYFVSSDNQQLTQKVLSSLTYENKPEQLETSVSRELYGEHIQGSVSRMEKFNSCPFSHFASHGLKLRERQFFKLEAPDIGQMFHSALKLISDRLHQLKLDWKELTKDQCERLSNDAVEQLAPRLQKEILLSSNRYHYIKRKLQKILARASSILSEHAKASGFAPVGLELGFGKGGELPPIRFTLPNGCTMEVAGRIDRVDKATGSNGVLLRIVDYKSSEKNVQLSEVYYGLALQMLTYLDVIISNSKLWLGIEATPAGVLYFHVHDPMIQASSLLPEEKLDDEIFKKFKMKGLLLGDEEAVKMMDHSLTEGSSSNIIAAGLKKDGGFRSTSSIASEAEFELLRHHVRSTFKKIGTNITDGIIDISPYKLKDKMPCTYCEYKSVCQFDESLEENNYRILKSEKNDEVLKRMREEAGVDE